MLVRTSTKHEQRTLILANANELKEIIRQWAQQQNNFPEHAEYFFNFEDETAGSPAYKIGTKLKLEVVVNLASAQVSGEAPPKK